jgi:hypothetical protein
MDSNFLWTYVVYDFDKLKSKYGLDYKKVLKEEKIYKIVGILK